MNDAPPKKRTPRKVSLDVDLGKAWRVQREQRGYSADEVAAIVGVSNGTVSNVELGKQKTLPGPVFMRWHRLLFGKGKEIPSALVGLAEETGDMTEAQLNELREIAKIIKKH